MPSDHCGVSPHLLVVASQSEKGDRINKQLSFYTPGVEGGGGSGPREVITPDNS